MAWVRNTPEGTPTEGPEITGIITAFTGFALVLLLLRIYVRVWLIKAMGWGTFCSKDSLGDGTVGQPADHVFRYQTTGSSLLLGYVSSA